MNETSFSRRAVFFLLFICFSIYPYYNFFPSANAQENSYYYMPNDAPIYWSGPINKNTVALTFDDGPNPIYTPKILSVLAKYNVKATFFIVGEQARQNIALIEEIVAEGHEIGSHTMRHPDANGTPLQQLQNEVLESVALLQNISNQKIKYFRPPYGHISPFYFAACQTHGITMILWSLDSNDWKKPPIEQLVKEITRQVQPGSIILLHDGGGDRQNTVEALDKLIPLLKQKNLTLATLSQMYE